MKQSLWLKLGCIAVHAEELISPDGHEFDKEALRGLLQDAEVRRFLDAPKNKVYFPRRRVEDDPSRATREGSERALARKTTSGATDAWPEHSRR